MHWEELDRLEPCALGGGGAGQIGALCTGVGFKWFSSFKKRLSVSENAKVLPYDLSVFHTEVCAPGELRVICV